MRSSGPSNQEPGSVPLEDATTFLEQKSKKTILFILSIFIIPCDTVIVILLLMYSQFFSPLYVIYISINFPNFYQFEVEYIAVHAHALLHVYFFNFILRNCYDFF